MIYHDHKAIFVAVPKTGSTSVRMALGSRMFDEGHAPHEDILQIRDRISKTEFSDYFKFGFVRNPWDRVVALYLRNEGVQKGDTMTFEEFVDWISLSSDTCIHPRPHKNQLDWFIDEDGNVLVDHIAKFEDMENEWRYIQGQLSLSEGQQLPVLTHENRRGAKRHYSEYYDQKTAKIIREKFVVDVEYFEYEFENSVKK